VYYYIAIKMNSGLDTLFEYGKFTADAASKTITGLLFQPAFAIGKLIDTVAPQWRSALIHTGANSTLWAVVTSNATGITAFTADGLSFGSTLSVVPKVTNWLAFKSSGEITLTALSPIVDAGADIALIGFGPVSMNASATGGEYACASLSYLWTRLSGPATVNFSSTTVLNPSVTFFASGLYVLRLTVSNGAESISDTLEVNVSCIAPALVSAGPDQTVLFGTIVQLAGEVF